MKVPHIESLSLATQSSIDPMKTLSIRTATIKRCLADVIVGLMLLRYLRAERDLSAAH